MNEAIQLPMRTGEWAITRGSENTGGGAGTDLATIHVLVFLHH